MRKSSSVVIAVIVLIVIAAGAYALFHKSNKSNITNTTHTTASQTSSNTPSVNNAVLITKSDPKLGKYLAEPNGAPLYTYNADSQGVSNCTGSCLAAWPAYKDNGATTNLPAGVGTIKRADNGQIQYTYNGLPLYTFVSDSNGQVNGNGVQNFSVAKPTAATSSQSTNAPSSSNKSSGSPY